MMAIFDLDGTLADCSHRLHWIEQEKKDYDRFYQDCVLDNPIQAMRPVLWGLWRMYSRVEIWTGRREDVRIQTRNWLDRWGLKYHRLLMRPVKDYRPDAELKESWLDMLPVGSRPDIVFEDRSRVVDMWRRRGVFCCQVSAGDY